MSVKEKLVKTIENIGFAKVLSDGIYNAAIYDLVVKDNYQNMNIGRKVLEDILLKLENYRVFIWFQHQVIVNFIVRLALEN